jgi:hypothetical protein
MLIGPAIGIENMKPARMPAMDMVIILSTTKPFSLGQRMTKKYSTRIFPLFLQFSAFFHPKIKFSEPISGSKYYF